MHPIRSSSALCGLLCLAVCFSTPLLADITVEEKATFDGFGGWGASESASVTRLSGDKLQNESTVKMTGKMMRFLSGKGGMKSGTITRLDRNVLYNIDYSGETYTEMSFEQFRQTGQEAMAQMQGQMPPQGAGQGEKPEMTCTPVELSARDTGQKEKIGGFDTSRFRIQGKQTCTNTETEEACTVSYDMSLWNTPATGKFKEYHAFMKRQAEAMGFDATQMRAMSGAAAAMFAGGGEGLQAAFEELSKAEGYPVRTRIEIFGEGSCGMQAEGSADAGGEDSGEKGGMASMKKFFGKFKKNKDKDAEPKQEMASSKGQPAAGRTKLFGMTNEVVSVSSGAIPASIFEPPAGFKKQEWNQR